MLPLNHIVIWVSSSPQKVAGAGRPWRRTAGDRRVGPRVVGAADGWPRRELKRQAAVAAVKELAVYQELEASRAAGYEAGAVPGTPDPRDRATSKRRWEKR